MDDLFNAFSCLKDKEEFENFLRDICTPKEIRDMSERLSIAKELTTTDKSYRQIASDLGASVTTVGRVARFLNEEVYQGYKIVIERLKK